MPTNEIERLMLMWGVILDALGQFLAIAARGDVSVFEAEARALLCGLELVVDLNPLDIEIEIDSALVVNLVRSSVRPFTLSWLY